jgi:hypothetical protein
VLNRGVNGEEVTDILARLETAVIAERPDLVLWQVGTNSVLRDVAFEPHVAGLHEGLVCLKATGADVVLIDPQYAPKVISKPACDGMVSLIAATARAEHVGVFHRFELMRHWHEAEHLPFETLVSQDGLHMNDWSYRLSRQGARQGNCRGHDPAHCDRGRTGHQAENGSLGRPARAPGVRPSAMFINNCRI